MPTQYRPNLLRRLLAWHSQPAQHDDPADMGTDIGLEYILAQRPRDDARPRGPAPAQPWQRLPS